MPSPGLQLEAEALPRIDFHPCVFMAKLSGLAIRSRSSRLLNLWTSQLSCSLCCFCQRFASAVLGPSLGHMPSYLRVANINTETRAYTGIAERNVPNCMAPPDAACAERYNTHVGQMSWPDRRLDPQPHLERGKVGGETFCGKGFGTHTGVPLRMEP